METEVTNIETNQAQTSTETVQNTNTVNKPGEVQVEVKSTEQVENKVEDNKIKNLMSLAKKESQLIREKRALAAEKAEYQKAIALLKDLETNPYKVIKEKNIPFDSLLDAHLASASEVEEKPEDKPKWAKRLEDEFTEYKKSLQTKAEQEKTAAQEQAWNNHIKSVSEYISKNSEKYEAILMHDSRATQLYQEIVSTALSELGRDHLSDEEVIACIDRTEELMTDEFRPLIERAAKSKKFAGLIPKNSESEPKKSEDKKTATIKTLTNNLTATAPATPKIADPKKSAWENRVAEVLAKRQNR